jgi:hypothetical protein
MFFLFFLLVTLSISFYLANKVLQKSLFVESKSEIFLENEHYIPIAYSKLSKLLSLSFESENDSKSFQKLEHLFSCILQHSYNSKFVSLDKMYETHFHPSIQNNDGKTKNHDKEFLGRLDELFKKANFHPLSKKEVNRINKNLKIVRVWKERKFSNYFSTDSKF